jgi:hypothetical protein
MRPHIRIESLVVETFSVVLGILLALSANAWHDKRSHDAQAREALHNILTEIAANRASVAAKVTYHSAMRDSLDALVARAHGKTVPGGLLAVKGWNGISPTRLVDDGWQSARATGAVQYIPYTEVLELSKSYGLQQRIADVQRAFYSVIYTPGFASGGVYALASMSSFLGDLSVNEQQLLRQYDKEIIGLRRMLGVAERDSA